MKLQFFKYQGAGNDFVVIDDREMTFDKEDNQLVKHLCDRRFGIGGDGLMLLRSAEGYDFEMVYYNADGYEGSMCGNGGRCIVAFAKQLGLFDQACKFIAVDGEHKASLLDQGEEQWVSLEMIPVAASERIEGDLFLDTGSPHYVVKEEALSDLDVVSAGRAIRFNERFKEEGTNVNFYKTLAKDELLVRTYERGVENETLACGTGVTACVIAAHLNGDIEGNEVAVEVLGGSLKVLFNAKDEGSFENIWLQGPAELVFEGEIDA